MKDNHECCVSWKSGHKPTCVYLKDGTKVVIVRSPNAYGSVWLEVQPQGIITTASPVSDKERIIALLGRDSRRDIYQSGSAPYEFYISYQGGGPFNREDVLEMFNSGVLERKYPEGECYRLAPTPPTPETSSPHSGLASTVNSTGTFPSNTASS